MRILFFSVLVGLGLASAGSELLTEHCAKCHKEGKAKGNFPLSELGEAPSAESVGRWVDILDLVKAEEMPPWDDSELSEADRTTLVSFLEEQLAGIGRAAGRGRG